MNPPPDVQWKVVAGSATGTSHIRAGSGCQDYCHFTFAGPRGAGVVLVCADGAGSASRAEVGARLACGAVLVAAAAALDEGLPVPDITTERVTSWYWLGRRRLALEACIEGIDLREYACTLLLAIVDCGGAVFAQLGDGAILFRSGESYETAFWPQSGEYANTTNFLTAPDFERHLAVRAANPAPDELALLTDGLQPLALHYATRTVHSPFFEPMFAALQGEPYPDRLQVPLRQFLTSTPVTERTDDDTTLILAARCPCPP